MAESSTEPEPVQYVEIDETLCNGCVLCMKACPTKAIRVRNNLASIEGVCIACGECINVCPRGAIKAVVTGNDYLNGAGYSIVSASTALYPQFGEKVMPNDVLLGLRRMGFRHVHDQAYTNEIFNVATELYIRERLVGMKLPFPVISPICPVVVRLIAYRFPSLLEHIPPLVTPREIVAREAKRRFSAKYGDGPEDVKVLHISPCPGKMICIKESVLQSSSYLDGAIGINSIYNSLKQNILEVKEDIVLHHSGGLGLGWAMSGGEVAGLDMDCIAVSGIQETIRYLEKIEMGLLHDIDYIEFRICTTGCLGGPFTVADKYQARHNLKRYVRMFGVEKRVKYEYVKKLYEAGWFFTDRETVPLEEKPPRISASEISKGIERQNRVEEILRLLPRKECGVCGSPDCRTFAEDVIDEKTSLESCVYWQKQKRKMKLN
ncbi:MAG: 4Fe-4S binding protein [Deltaproteobacteria bacterium]|nr:4Fe-4S binding protein [Deltaproteobacteria bacterium]MBW2118061.1 4Fe-4S binding protein [Deltaproteobacteria bacterium]MBW2345633.1 4Fe-4S binding protein [Deltaproteobacteria bacterium]